MAGTKLFVDVGFGNIVAASRILCVAGSDSAPIRRIIQDARDRSVLVDACAGKKCHSVLVMDSDHIILSSLEVSEIKDKLEKGE
ncbi:MAG: DUF370 domain-containing protein [Clostridia bacterium]|nr:DUF370 domain-containing protein [Clostridia bacterium]